MNSEESSMCTVKKDLKAIILTLLAILCFLLYIFTTGKVNHVVKFFYFLVFLVTLPSLLVPLYFLKRLFPIKSDSTETYNCDMTIILQNFISIGYISAYVFIENNWSPIILVNNLLSFIHHYATDFYLIAAFVFYY